MGFALGPKATAGGYRLAAYDTIGSTSTEAMDRARAGDPGRLWVVAREQTAGHGRRGRPWQTARGNLAASLLLRLDEPRAPTATLGFAAGLALEQAIRTVAPEVAIGIALDGSEPAARSKTLSRRERVAAEQPGEGLRSPEARATPSTAAPPHPPASRAPSPSGRRDARHARLRLKWPNDVLVDGAKVAGILLQAVTGSGDANAVVIGIGVNVRHAPQGVPYPATSLADCGAEVTAEDLSEALSDAWVDQEALWDCGRGFPAVRRRWLDHAAGLGAPIAVRLGDDVFRGTFETIDADGRLVVRAADGATRSIAAGDVHFGAAATAGAGG
jgi:BirA family biotin operon repressor/biotin-[acetyl-CoA-carboxylase] ligase